jgi:hypothetical protein
MKNVLIIDNDFKKTEYVLEGIFTEFTTKSYPSRIYGLYKWNSKKKNWDVDKEYCDKYNIPCKWNETEKRWEIRKEIEEIKGRRITEEDPYGEENWEE